MKPSFEQKEPTQVSDQEFMRYKNEIQVRLMVDAGIQPDDEVQALEWIKANAERLDTIFDRKLAEEYQLNPSDTVIKVKSKLYH